MRRPVTVVPAPVRVNGTAFFGAAGCRVHEVERRDAEVVVGARFDRDFLEWSHLAVAGRANDSHVRRPILERADEILGVARDWSGHRRRRGPRGMSRLR